MLSSPDLTLSCFLWSFDDWVVLCSLHCFIVRRSKLILMPWTHYGKDREVIIILPKYLLLKVHPLPNQRLVRWTSMKRSGWSPRIPNNTRKVSVHWCMYIYSGRHNTRFTLQFRDMSCEQHLTRRVNTT